MKSSLNRAVFAAGLLLAGSVFAAEPEWKTGYVKACWFRENISCEVGTLLSGYGQHDVSVEKLDELEACGLCLDDGERRVLMVSFDLLGMENDLITAIRDRFAALLGTSPDCVLLSCTHTHGGPQTRKGLARDATTCRRTPIDARYTDAMTNRLVGAVRDLAEKGDWRTCRVGYYSVQVDENRNRRFTTPDNSTAAAEYRRQLLDIGAGIADKELGLLVLVDGVTLRPLYLVGNYAAHALAAHAPGRGGYRITADYPGWFRRYLTQEMGCEAMFVTGASGDLVPKENELGSDSARRTGVNLAKAAMGAFLDVQRNTDIFLLKEPKVGGLIQRTTVPYNARYRKLFGKETVDLEMQCVAVGDVAFVGVPGEFLNALGLEIKWHSPFRRTFIAYNSTGYLSYVLPLHETCSGGYEPQLQQIRSRYSLNLVLAAQEGLLTLRERMFPTPPDALDPYPDCIDPPLFNVPGMYKASKWSSFQK